MKDFICQSGLNAQHHARAVELYWQAFGPKLGKVMGPTPKAHAFFLRVLDSDHAISAIAPDGSLWGVAGFKTDTGAFTGGTWSDLMAIYGFFGALWRVAFLAFLERENSAHTLTMDGIFVASEARGQGVGSALLEEIVQKARDLDKSSVRLDVIDTNPRARALYERRGFIETGQQHLGPLRWIFGFNSATTMVRNV